MLQNKLLGKYDWGLSDRAGIGLAWAVAGFVLPMLVWAIYVLARVQGLVAQTAANPMWAVVWLLFCLPCLMIAAKCFGWKGKALLGKLLFMLFAYGILSVLAGLWVALTIVDGLK